MSELAMPSVTRLLRAAVKVGDDYYTLEETITLPANASDEQISQAVATGLRMYEAQRVAVEAQIRDLRTTPGAPTAVQIREPDAPASEKQRQYMEYLLKELSWDNERLVAFAGERQFNLLTLTKREASELIDQMKGVLAGEAEQSQQNGQRIEQRDADRNLGAPAPAIQAGAEQPLFDDDAPEQVAPPEPEQVVKPIGERATQRQVRALERLVDERGIDLEAELRKRFGDRGLVDLSMDEAGQLLSEWQQLPRQIRPRTANGNTRRAS